MNQEWLSFVTREYGLQAERMNSARLFFQPLSSFYHQDIENLARVADYLRANGRLTVCQMEKNKEGRLVAEYRGTKGILMAAPLLREEERTSIGTYLARFHRQTWGVNSRLFQESPIFHGTEYWIERVDELQKHYDAVMNKNEKTPFEKMFLDNYPYFSGIADNAIQYMVDLNLDAPQSENAVICHYRLSSRQPFIPENPAGWVIDFRSRDIAEWLRQLIWGHEERSSEAIVHFLSDYHAEFPLTVNSLARVYGRLLFPLSFLECCENYFSGDDRMSRQVLISTLEKNAEKAGDVEATLKMLAEQTDFQIKSVEWLG